MPAVVLDYSLIRARGYCVVWRAGRRTTKPPSGAFGVWGLSLSTYIYTPIQDLKTEIPK